MTIVGVVLSVVASLDASVEMFVVISNEYVAGSFVTVIANIVVLLVVMRIEGVAVLLVTLVAITAVV